MFHVVEIADEYTLLINYGLKDNAKRGDVLRIYTPGDEICDPITGSVIGTLDIIKAEVKVITAYENFSICQKTGFNSPPLSPLAALAQKVSAEKLPVEPGEVMHRNGPEASPIHVGDPVKVISA